MFLDFKSVLPTEDSQFDFSCQMDFSQVEVSGVYPFISPVEVTGSAQRRVDAVFLKADVAFDFSYPCDRCAMVFTRHYDLSFTHRLVSSLQDDADDETILLEGDGLDVDKLLRDDILLQLPMKLLCKPDCKGICPTCGKNRNTEQCDCVIHQVDPRLEVLKKLID